MQQDDWFTLNAPPVQPTKGTGPTHQAYANRPSGQPEDWFSQNAPPGAKGGVETVVPEAPAQQAPEDRDWLDSAFTFVKTVGEDLNPVPALEMLFGAGEDQGFVAMVKGLGRNQADQFTKAKSAYDEGNYQEAIGYTAAGLVPLMGPAVSAVGEDFEEGNYAEGAAHLTTLLSPFALNKYRAVLAKRRTGGSTTQTSPESPTVQDAPLSVAEQVKARVASAFPRIKGPPEVVMQSAIKPIATHVNWDADIRRAMPSLKAAEGILGRPISSLQDLVEATRIAKAEIWKQYEAMLGPRGRATIDGNKIADSMMDSIPAKVRQENPAFVARLQERANTYRREYGLMEAEDFIETLNAELESFYRTNNSDANAALGVPSQRAKLHQVEAIRDALHSKLDELGATGSREIKRDYGALVGVGRSFDRRLGTLRNHQQFTLAEKMGYAHGLGSFAGGLASGHFGMALKGAGEGIGNIALARYLKHLDDTNTKIAGAFGRFRRTEFKPIVQPPPPAGLLPSGPRMATHDPNLGVEFNVTQGRWPDPPPPAGLLPPGPRRMPPRGQTPISVTPAPSHVQQGPGGRFQRVYTGGERALPPAHTLSPGARPGGNLPPIRRSGLPGRKK